MSTSPFALLPTIFKLLLLSGFNIRIGNLEGAELDLHHALHEGDCCGIFEGVLVITEYFLLVTCCYHKSSKMCALYEEAKSGRR